MKSKILKSFFRGMTLPTSAALGGPFTYVKRKPQEPLKMNSDGKFRILHLTDIHLITAIMEEDFPIEQTQLEIDNTLNVIEESIKRTNPDLIVFTGDNVSSNWELITYNYCAEAIRYMNRILEKYNIPLAVVFGNHDGERQMHKEFQMRIFMEYDNCRATYNNDDVYGVGTYNLPILSSDGSRIAFNLWMFDSNDYLDGIKSTGYDCVHKDQLDWYLRESEKLRIKNGGELVTSMVFQHIPVPEEYDVLIEANKNTVGAVEGRGKYYILPDGVTGQMGESPCPPEKRYDKQFEIMKNRGDVVAMFFGHDHLNDFELEKDGIKLIQTLCAGYTTYGDKRGGRLIVINEDNPRQFETESFTIPWKDKF